MYSNILVPVDLSHGEVGARIISLARRIGGPEARITVLHVVDALPGYVASQIPEEVLEMHRTETRERVETLVAGVDPTAQIAIRKGSPASVILEEAADIGADAIVLGSHRPDYRDYLIGSTAARVVRHAGCSVVVDRGAVESD